MLRQSACYFIKYCSLVIYRFTQLENQQEGGATDASGTKLSILYQLQFAFYNRSSLDSCSLFKVAQTNSDVAIGDVHKIRNNL